MKLFCGMLDCLTFLPEDDVAEGMTYARENIPDGFEPLLQYFDNTYVSGSYRQIQPPQRPDGTIPPIRIRRKPPMFAPSIWNVHTITLEVPEQTTYVRDGTMDFPSW